MIGNSAATDHLHTISLEEIARAQMRLRDVVTLSPLQISKNLSEKYTANIMLKREDLQQVRSFKIRGAYNKMKAIESTEMHKTGVVCASAGNHAQGVAFACAKLKVNGTIFMPSTTPKQKVNRVKYFGGDFVKVILTGDTFDDAKESALSFCEDQKAHFIHPFNDVQVIAGQATIAAEILQQADKPIDYIFVAVGGGGLMAGVGSYFKILSPHTKVISVEAAGAPALSESLRQNKVVTLENIDSFADGIAVKSVGDITFPIVKSVSDDLILVPEGKICSTMLELYNDEALIVEPAGAISIAALDFCKEEIAGKNVCIIVCGGNNDITRIDEIRERALLYEGLKHYFIIRFPQRAGALREFLDLLGPNDDITHFEYTKKNNRDSGPALVGIELKKKEHFESLEKRMLDAQINFEHINNNSMLFELFI